MTLATCDKYCLFESGSCWFALPAVAIREVAARPSLAGVPNTPPALHGLCHLRNEFLPVLSLPMLLGLESAEPQQGRQMLIVDGTHSTWGCLVDRVAALESLETSLARESDLDGGWSSPIIGTATYRDEVARVLEPEAMYRLAQQLLEDFWSHRTPQDDRQLAGV